MQRTPVGMAGVVLSELQLITLKLMNNQAAAWSVWGVFEALWGNKVGPYSLPKKMWSGFISNYHGIPKTPRGAKAISQAQRLLLQWISQAQCKAWLAAGLVGLQGVEGLEQPKDHAK
jgi:hypothetical protein